MKAEILCVGTELLLGDIINTNAAFIAKGLADCGVGCYHQAVVGDNPGRLEECLRASLMRSDIVITTGGLGPTYDDLTKETVAKYFGCEMELHEPSLERLRELFVKFGRPMTKNNEKQAFFPKDATIFFNDRGTAPGLAVEQDGKTVIMMPGPPREMTAMFDNHVKPYLQKRSGSTLVSHSIHMFGIGESTLESELRDYMESMQNPTIAPYAKEGEVLLRVTASAPTTQEADKLIAPVVAYICKRYEKYVYGFDSATLENALVAELASQGRTIAVAESCTGGLMAKRITDIAGSSKVIGMAICTYSNDAKQALLKIPSETLEQHGAVSPQTAQLMAEGVRALAGSDIGIGVTGIAGPGGGTAEKPVGLIYIGISSARGSRTVELKLGRGYGGERSFIRHLASSSALYQALAEARGQQ